MMLLVLRLASLTAVMVGAAPADASREDLPSRPQRGRPDQSLPGVNQGQSGVNQGSLLNALFTYMRYRSAVVI
jgi:hypothetical protein